MTDMEDRFHSLDRVPMPELWGEATLRAVAKPQAGPQIRTNYMVPLGLATAAIVIALIVGLGVLWGPTIGTPEVTPTPSSSTAPAEPTAIVGQIIEAVNARDVETMRSLMGEDGVLEFPWVDARAGSEGLVFMSDLEINIETFPEGWMTVLDSWRMEAELGSCEPVADSAITCAVATRWHVLQIEIGESWTFEFDGERVTRLEMLRVDPDPTNRVLPLGLADLSNWEAWLRETHPSQAARLLPSGPDLFGWMYFRFGLDASPEEIGDSIREYLGSPTGRRHQVVGTYVCAEQGNPASTHSWDVREEGTIIRGTDENGESLPAGTWSLDNGQLRTTFGGGITWFAIQGNRLVIGDWTCTRDG